MRLKINNNMQYRNCFVNTIWQASCEPRALVGTAPVGRGRCGLITQVDYARQIAYESNIRNQACACYRGMAMERYFGLAALSKDGFFRPARGDWQMFGSEAEMSRAFRRAVASAIAKKETVTFYACRSNQNHIEARYLVGRFDPASMMFEHAKGVDLTLFQLPVTADGKTEEELWLAREERALDALRAAPAKDKGAWSGGPVMWRRFAGASGCRASDVVETLTCSLHEEDGREIKVDVLFKNLYGAASGGGHFRSTSVENVKLSSVVPITAELMASVGCM